MKLEEYEKLFGMPLEQALVPGKRLYTIDEVREANKQPWQFVSRKRKPVEQAETSSTG